MEAEVAGRFVAVGNAKMMARLSSEFVGGVAGDAPESADAEEGRLREPCQSTCAYWWDVKGEREMASSWEADAATAAWVWVSDVRAGGRRAGGGEGGSEERRKGTGSSCVGEASGGVHLHRTGVVAFFGAVDAPRMEAASTVRRLRRLGVESVMLTGDSHTVAAAIQRQVCV